MKTHLRLAAALFVLHAGSAHAAGYYAGNKGARAAGRGGAFTARADDLTAVTYNPAGLSKVDGTLIHLGNRFSYNTLTFTRAPTVDPATGLPVTFQPSENQEPLQLLDPLAGVATNFGLPGWGFALAAIAPAGVSVSEYPLDGGQRYLMTRRETQLIGYNLSAAYQLTDMFSLGVTFQALVMPKLDYDMVIDGTPTNQPNNPIRSTYDVLAKTQGTDLFTPNLYLGAMFKPKPWLEVGLSAQVLPGEIETESELEVEPVSDTLKARVQEIRLFRNRAGTTIPEPASDIEITLPLPQTVRAGVRYIGLEDGQENFDVELDVAYERWSAVNALTMDSFGARAEVDGPANVVPVDTITVPKQWRDTLIVSLGGDFALVPNAFTLRAGAYYETAVADPAYSHVDVASGAQMGGTLGGSLFLMDGALELAVMLGGRYQPTVTVSESQGRVYQEVPICDPADPMNIPGDASNLCAPPFQNGSPPAPVVNAGTFDAYSLVGALDLLYRF